MIQSEQLKFKINTSNASIICATLPLDEYTVEEADHERHCLLVTIYWCEDKSRLCEA